MNGHELIKAIENFDLDQETNVSGVQSVDGTILVEVESVVVVRDTDTSTDLSKATVHRKKKR